MDSATTDGVTGGEVLPDDIEAKLREIFEGAREDVASARSQVATVGGILAILAVLLTFVLGRRSGRKRSTVVEIRRV